MRGGGAWHTSARPNSAIVGPRFAGSANGDGEFRLSRRITWSCVKAGLTLFALTPAAPYSSKIQQPRPAATVPSKYPHTHWAAAFDHERARAGSLHPDGSA